MKRKKSKKWICILAIVIAGIFLSLFLPNTVAQAGELIEDTIDDSNEYSKYPDRYYQLDFNTDDCDWLEKIGVSLDTGIFYITDGFWWLSRTLSNATGYIVQEAYSLDFISEMSYQIGKNIQTLAGVTRHGFSDEGFYVGLLPLLILVLGVYVTYTGLIKRETTRAFNAVINFVVIFILSTCFIAYASNFILKINDFSTDMSTSALSLGTKILTNSNTEDKDSVDLIRDCLFEIQVKQPWLLLQFGNSSIEEIGEERVNQILEVDPDDVEKNLTPTGICKVEENEARKEAVKNEIDENSNVYLTPAKTSTRLGMVILFFICNLVISVSVISLAGLMLFSQMLFIFYATMLPFSFIISMFPTYNGLAKKAVESVFNVLMLRTGYTIIITVAFSISSMLYALSSDRPFIFIIFLQILTFVGILFNHQKMLGMMLLQGSDNQGLSKQFNNRVRHVAGRVTRPVSRYTRRKAREFGGKIKFVKERPTVERPRKDYAPESHSGEKSKERPNVQKQPSANKETVKNRENSNTASSTGASGKGNQPSGGIDTNKSTHHDRPNQSGSSSGTKKPDSENRKPVSDRKNSSAHERPVVEKVKSGHQGEKNASSGPSGGEVKHQRANVDNRYPMPPKENRVTNINGVPYTDEQIKNNEHERTGQKRKTSRRNVIKPERKGND